MQPVNDDMDNLFRQAAENYPLNTQGADFDKLLQRMDDAGENAPPKKESRRRYGWLLLLLLLPLPFLCRHYYSSGTEDEIPVAEQQLTKSAGQPTAVSDQKASTPDNATADNQPSSATNTLANTNSNTAPGDVVQSNSSFSDVAEEQQNTNEAGLPVQESNSKMAGETSAATVQHTKKLAGTNSRKPKRTNPKQNSSYPASTVSSAYAGSNLGKSKPESSSSDKTSFASGIALPATERGRQPDSLLQKDTARSFADKRNDTVNSAIATKAAAKDSTASDSALVVKKQKDNSKKIKPFMYVGAIAGVDYSVVKSNQTAGTGYNTGLVAGYRFGPHWAVETGLLWAYKKYRAEGKYIDTAGLGIAGHTQVMNAKGSCGILEIPLMVQYHFNSKGSSHWYAVAGLSSYLIKKEEYYYVGKRYNMVYYAEKEYTNSTKNWFSILQLGGGYQLQLGKRSSLRAEPYVKLPLSKIGIAKMPLSSAGINIGYIRPL